MIWPHLLILGLIGYTSMFGNISVPNERSRIYMATALVDEGTTSIDSSLERFGRIGDRAIFQGKHYSDKAPGTGYMGAIIYQVVRIFTEPSEWKIHHLLQLMRIWICLPLALLGWFWLRRLLCLYFLSQATIECTSLGWLLGTAAFHYSGAFFGHQIAATFLLGSWLWMKRAIDEGGRLAPLFSGLLSGFAVFTEYPAGIGVVTIGIFGLLHVKELQWRLGLWVLGGVPFALALMYYHVVCFGHPLALPYQHLAAKTYQKIHNAGMAGVTRPEWSGFSLWFLSLKRGLFTTSPLMIYAFFGWFPLLQKSWREAVALITLLIMVTLFASGAHIWGGDWGYGPRILVFSLGLLMIPVAFVIERSLQCVVGRWMTLSLTLYGVLVTQLIHLFFPEPWAKSKNPLVDVVYPMFKAGITSPNWISVHFSNAGLLSTLPVIGAVGFLMIRLSLQVEKQRKPKTFIAVIITVTLAFCSVTSFPASQPKIQQDWVKLVLLWNEREVRYHP